MDRYEELVKAGKIIDLNACCNVSSMLEMDTIMNGGQSEKADLDSKEFISLRELEG